MGFSLSSCENWVNITFMCKHPSSNLKLSQALQIKKFKYQEFRYKNEFSVIWFEELDSRDTKRIAASLKNYKAEFVA